MTLAELRQVFLSPGPDWRGKPFWAWNGKLERDELLRQVGVLADMGFGGFFMHSRVGLATEYLGDEWFELINACADEGARLGLEAWLYDEDRWPSGIAGGRVTAEPRYRLKFLRCRVVPGAEFSWSPDLVAAFSCEVGGADGLDVRDARRLSADSPAADYRDRQVLAFTTEELACDSFYNGNTYVDALNREATEEFLRLTHEEYARHCGGRLGTSIRGIFTDEPHRGALMDGFSIPNPDSGWLVPWTYTVFDLFRERFGYDVVERLPELFLRPEGRPVSQVKWHYVELLQQMFLENYAAPVNEWCERHGIILTGHILHEDSLAAQTAMCGSVMRFYEHMGYPGVDVLTEGNRAWWIVKQLTSAARQLGRRWLLSELYGCTGWQMSLYGHKTVGDWQALFGINLRCPHLSWYTMEGEAKRDFPASIFHQSAWWRDYAEVETYFARLGLVLSQGEACCDLLVVNPVESVWCQIHPGWSRSLGARAEAVKELEASYADLFRWLAGAQLDFDYGDEEMMGRLAAVEEDGDGAPVLRVGQARYRAVVVGKMTTIRATTLAILREFLAAGGKVIFAGDAPGYVDALESGEARQVAEAEGATRVALEPEAVVAACVEAAGRQVEVVDAATGEALGDIFCQLRADGDRRYLVALNINRERAHGDALIRVRGAGAAEEWECLTGERWVADAVQGGDEGGGWLEIRTSFPAGGERVYILACGDEGEDEGEVGGEELLARPDYEILEVEELAGPFDYRLEEPNLCVLDRARWRVDGGESGEWQPEREVLKVDRAVRDHFGLAHRGGNMLQPWFAAEQGQEVLGRVALAYEFYVEELPAGPVELVMEHPEDFRVTLNGRELTADEGGAWWVDIALKRLAVPAGALVEGRNVVEIEGDFRERVGFEALYLRGDFGVRLDGTRKTLVALPERLALGDLTAQGLPFYSAGVTYVLRPEARAEADERLFITVPDFAGACGRLAVGKDELPGPPEVDGAEGGEAPGARLLPWPPHEADVTDLLGDGDALDLTVVLTRRNTFGPLHQVPLQTAGYGPENFVTEGAGWAENYQLWPAGLMEPPQIERRRRV